VTRPGPRPDLAGGAPDPGDTPLLPVARGPAGAAAGAPGAAARAGRASSHVLLVDADPVTRRFVELALGREPDLEIESAVDGAGALEILSRSPVHLVIAETDFGDMNGLQFFRRLNQGVRLRNVPFVFFTGDARITTKVVALSAGVDDYLVKPCDGAELVARMRALLARQRRALAAARARTYSLAGELSALSFADLIAILELGRRSGTVSVVTKDRAGSVHLDQGRVVHAAFGTLVGQRAFVWLLAQESGHFEFSPGPCPIPPAERTIGESVQSLMMESARIIDTEKASGSLFVPEEREAVPVPDTAPGDSVPIGLATGYQPEAGAASQLESAVRDGYSLADLQIFSREELAQWTQAAPARDRLHVVLVADLAAGVVTMLSLAGAPSERWVLGSLGPDAKAMGLAFFLRRERLVDVVLVDVRNPGQFLPQLRRTPSLVIVAPPTGDGLALGTKARVELADLLDQLRPRALLGLGNDALRSALASVTGVAAAAGGPRQRVLRGVLGEPPLDLRTVLAEGIRLVAGQAETVRAV
jgi:DNA-binding response OmpR family regulator